MAPSKKSKSVSDLSPRNIDDKSKHKKRKLTDMLGPQWSNHEIERFYDAYRKYGKDWKKVSGAVRSRSIGMVEALFNMNRAYLSLPEGTASVVGLIAMMTDHYNVMDGSGSEKESEGPEVMARKFHKNSKAKSPVDSSRDYVKRLSGSSDGCLSLLKSCGDGIQPRFPVRKRTPRVLVTCLDNNPNKKSRVSAMHENNEGAFRGDSMLPKVWKNPNSPQGLQTTYKNVECVKTAKEQEISPYRVIKIKNGGCGADEESKDGSLGCNVARNGIFPRELVDSGKSSMGGYKIGKKMKREEVQPSETTIFDNVREANVCGHKGAKRNCFDGKGVKHCRSISEGRKKKTKKQRQEDELAACDALHALAEISSMMPFLDEECAGVDARESMVERNAVVDKDAQSDTTLSDEKLSGDFLKQGRKARKTEVSDCSRKTAEESVADEEVKSGNSSGQISTFSKRCYSSVRSPDLSSSNDPHRGELEVAVCSAEKYSANEVVNIPRRKNKRKRDRTLLVKDKNNALNGCLNGGLSMSQDNLMDVRGKLLHCLSWREVQKWCMYEWFYSAIDYPWFAKREFEEYLNHVGLGHIPRLTRFELGVIRSSLGRPRRFSERFLEVEREKLKIYRESVRCHYSNVRTGRGGLPPDLACPLYVGQHVVAIHPKTRECHNGSVLTVDYDNCRVQFHNPDLGVELVPDLDCMPLNPLENIPEAMKSQKKPFNHPYIQHSKVNGAISSAFEEHMKNVDHNNSSLPLVNAFNANDMKVKPSCLTLNSKAVTNGSFSTQLATQNHSRNMAQMCTQDAFVRPIPGLTGDLDRKVLNLQIPGSENIHSLCPPIRNAVDLNGTLHSSNNSSFCCEENTTSVAEIVEGSREKAQKMVETAIKAMSIMKDDEDAFGRISEALDANCKPEGTNNGGSFMTMNSNTPWGSLPSQNPVASCNSTPQIASDMKSDLEIPSDLITSCVATLIMIQNCTERQYPPAEVAQILDNATTSLQPCCPQNVSMYREIQMCMGRIKTQILALVPT